jgi:hypothetical protein
MKLLLILGIVLLTSCQGELADIGLDITDDPPGWQDGGPETQVDAGSCSYCGVGEVCLMRFNKNCDRSTPVCVKSDKACFPGTCVPECEQTLCVNSQCKIRVLCGWEIEGVFACYER